MPIDWTNEQCPNDKAVQQKLAETLRIPRHVAVIMDGNGRWAQLRGMMRAMGHQEGMNSVRDIVKASSQIGVRYLTLYAFSMENWKRPHTEVNVLMSLLEQYLRQEVEELHANNVRVTAIGKLSALPKTVQSLLRDSIEKTSDNTGLTLCLALSYSGRWDLTRAMQMIALDVRRGKLSPEDLTDELVGKYLLTSEMPDPDLLIRTSGEMRLSNFLLWESAYSEIYVTDVLWPDFRRTHLYEAITDFACRERRFGKTSEQVREETKGYFRRVLDMFNGR